MDDAKDYLRQRADWYADSDEQREEQYIMIEHSQFLTLDAATASIEEIED